MKKLHYLGLLMGVFIFLSCQQEAPLQQVETEASQINFTEDYSFLNDPPNSIDYSRLKDGWTINCSGQCDCYLQWDLNTNIHSCSCTECAMTIQYHDENVADSKIDDFFKAQYDFTQIIASELRKELGNTVVRIKQIDHQFGENYRLSVVEYWDKDELKSFGIYENLQNRGPKFRVDCTGTCGCLEQFNPATGMVSCSCSECNMVIEEIED